MLPNRESLDRNRQSPSHHVPALTPRPCRAQAAIMPLASMPPTGHMRAQALGVRAQALGVH